MSGFNLPGQDISQIFKAAAKGAVVDGAEDVSIDSKVMTTKKSTPLSKTLAAESSLEKKDTNIKDVKEDVKEEKETAVPTDEHTEHSDNSEDVHKEEESAEEHNESTGNTESTEDKEFNENIETVTKQDSEGDFLHSVKKEAPISKENVEKIISLYTKANECNKEDIQFLSALLFKDAYKNINNFVYGAVNLSKQDITEAKLLYQLFTIESRVERVFTLLDIPYEKLERMSFTMEVLGDTEISGDSQKSLSKNIESEIARFVDAKGEDFFRNNNQLLTDMLISMI